MNQEEVLKAVEEHMAIINSTVTEYCNGLISAIGGGQLLQLQTVAPEKNLGTEISELLYKMGVPAHIRGYKYLRDAIELVVKDESILQAITKNLYPSVGEKHGGCSASKVERAIRHAIELTFLNGNMDLLNKIFASRTGIHLLNGKPSNSEFIATVAEWLRIKAA